MNIYKSAKNIFEPTFFLQILIFITNDSGSKDEIEELDEYFLETINILEESIKKREIDDFIKNANKEKSMKNIEGILLYNRFFGFKDKEEMLNIDNLINYFNSRDHLYFFEKVANTKDILFNEQNRFNFKKYLIYIWSIFKVAISYENKTNIFKNYSFVDEVIIDFLEFDNKNPFSFQNLKNYSKKLIIETNYLDNETKKWLNKNDEHFSKENYNNYSSVSLIFEQSHSSEKEEKDKLNLSYFKTRFSNSKEFVIVPKVNVLIIVDITNDKIAKNELITHYNNTFFGFINSRDKTLRKKINKNYFLIFINYVFNNKFKTGKELEKQLSELEIINLNFTNFTSNSMKLSSIRKNNNDSIDEEVNKLLELLKYKDESTFSFFNKEFNIIKNIKLKSDEIIEIDEKNNDEKNKEKPFTFEVSNKITSSIFNNPISIFLNEGTFNDEKIYFKMIKTLKYIKNLYSDNIFRNNNKFWDLLKEDVFSSKKISIDNYDYFKKVLKQLKLFMEDGKNNKYFFKQNEKDKCDSKLEENWNSFIGECFSEQEDEFDIKKSVKFLSKNEINVSFYLVDSDGNDDSNKIFHHYFITKKLDVKINQKKDLYVYVVEKPLNLMKKKYKEILKKSKEVFNFEEFLKFLMSQIKNEYEKEKSINKKEKSINKKEAKGSKETKGYNKIMSTENGFLDYYIEYQKSNPLFCLAQKNQEIKNSFIEKKIENIDKNSNGKFYIPIFTHKNNLSIRVNDTNASLPLELADIIIMEFENNVINNDFLDKFNEINIDYLIEKAHKIYLSGLKKGVVRSSFADLSNQMERAKNYIDEELKNPENNDLDIKKIKINNQDKTLNFSHFQNTSLNISFLYIFLLEEGAQIENRPSIISSFFLNVVDETKNFYFVVPILKKIPKENNSSLESNKN